MTTNAQSGFVMLRVAGFVFVIGIIAAIVTTVRLWGAPSVDELVSAHPTPLTDVPTDVDTSILAPTFTVGEDLDGDKAQLEEKLFIPLRNFYATKKERLASVSVVSSSDEEHTTKVQMILLNEENEEQTLEFFFDREGEERDEDFPTWTLSDLDNTN